MLVGAHATGDLWALLLVGAASDVECVCVCVCLRFVSELSLTEQSCLVEIC